MDNTDQTHEPTATEPTGEETANTETKPTSNYSLDTPPEPNTEPNPEGQEQAPNPEPEEPYTLSFEEDLNINEQLSELITSQAKSLGLDAKTTTSFISNIVKELQASETEAFDKDDADLKQEWGARYEQKLAAAKKTAHSLMASSGLSEDDLAPLCTPKGMRLLNAISAQLGEKPLAGANNGASTNPEDEANTIIKDPTHRYHNALMNPSHPQHKEANTYYNKLVGLTQK